MIIIFYKKKVKKHLKWFIVPIIPIILVAVFFSIINYERYRGVFFVAGEMQDIDTESYNISVPSNWKIIEYTNGVTFLDFVYKEKKIGWLRKLGYITFGNYYKVINQRELTISGYQALEVELLREKPAVIEDNTKVMELHIFIKDTKSKEYYNIAVLNEFLDEKDFFNIVKTFQIK